MVDVASLLTAERLRLVCPKIRGDILESIITDAPDAFPAAGLDDPIKIAHFIAQIATETGGLARLDENLNYTTTDRLQKVFGKKVFPTAASAQPFVKNPEALANKVYGKKNGNSQPGDGFTYRGSGLIQLTGRGNFKKVGELVGMPLEAEPELARHPDSALKIALGYWTARKINEVAGKDTEAAVTAVTKRINPALVGLEDRQAFFRKAVKVFAAKSPPAAISHPSALAPRATARMAAAAPRAAAAPAAAAGGLEFSGPQWVDRFPTSREISDLASPFAGKVDAFVKALKDAGANVRISATFRPKERAYLMHWAWEIGRNGLATGQVPPMAGVAIQWTHPTEAKSRTAARQMVAGFGMVQIAALNSRHTERLAIDMTISWNGALPIRQQNGSTRTISSQPRNGGNGELIAVGRGYGVIKLPSDPPHWSEDGR